MWTCTLPSVSPSQHACRTLQFAASIRIAHVLTLTEAVLSLIFLILLVASITKGYLFNLLLAFITLLDATLAFLVIRQGLSASALVAHSIWKLLQFVLLMPAVTILTVALVRDGHLGASSAPSLAVVVVCIVWAYTLFVGCLIVHSARLGRRLWKRKRTTPFGRGPSIRSVLSFISTEDTCVDKPEGPRRDSVHSRRWRGEMAEEDDVVAAIINEGYCGADDTLPLCIPLHEMPPHSSIAPPP